MQRFLGVLILAVTVMLLGHPAIALPPLAMLPILAVILPVASFYITVAPDEPQLCRVPRTAEQTRLAKCERRHPLQL